MIRVEEKVKYLSVREIIKKYEVSIEYISTKLMIANYMIKSLWVEKYKNHVKHMRLINSFCT